MLDDMDLSLALKLRGNCYYLTCVELSAKGDEIPFAPVRGTGG